MILQLRISLPDFEKHSMMVFTKWKHGLVDILTRKEQGLYEYNVANEFNQKLK